MGKHRRPEKIPKPRISTSLFPARRRKTFSLSPLGESTISIAAVPFRGGHLVESTIFIVAVQSERKREGERERERVPPRTSARDRQPSIIDNTNVCRLRVDVSHFEAIRAWLAWSNCKQPRPTRKTSAFHRDQSGADMCVPANSSQSLVWNVFPSLVAVVC